MDQLDYVFIILTIAGALIGLGFGILMHEMGHAAAAYANSWPITKIVLGSGPVWWRVPSGLNYPEFELRLLPRSGTVYAKIPPNASKLQRLMFVSGGVAVNFILVLVGLTAYFLTDFSSAGKGFWLEFSAVQLLLLRSLWPHHGTVNGRKIKSDGLQIWHIIRNKKV